MEKEDQFFIDNTPDENPDVPKDYLAMFKSSVLDQTKHYPDPLPVINIIQNGNKYPLLTLISYSLWQGKSKSKKTTVLAMAIAAYISQNNSADQIRFEREGAAGVVLFIDAEQGKSYAARTMKLILKMAGLNTSDNLLYCDFREFTPNDRLGMIDAAIKETQGIKIVVIDGIVDLMDDFQSAQEGHHLITSLITICSKYNVHVAGILHQNKADKNARSHVGTISGQKCEIEIACEVDKGVTVVECRASRGLPFETFAIRWDKGQLPCIVQEYKSGVAEVNNRNRSFDVDSLSIEEHRALVEVIFIDDSEYNDGQLKDQIKLNLKKKGKITDPIARQFVAHWQKQKLIQCYKGLRNAKIFRLPHSVIDDT